jgi:hypothetical protein
MRVRWSAAAVLLASCAAHPSPSSEPATAAPAAAEARPAPPARVAWALTWRGAAIGGAWERDSPEHFERREQIVVRRGDDIVISDLAITIERDSAGFPYQVGVTRWQDGPVLEGTAMRSVDGSWNVELEGEPPATLPSAVPFELVLRAGDEFHGTVLLAGWGFATAHLDLIPASHTAWLFVSGRLLDATVVYDADGAIAEVVGGDGIVAHRAAIDADLRPRQPPEVVDGNAITLTGTGASLVLPDAAPRMPIALPGQRPLSGQPWSIALDPAFAGDVEMEQRGADRTDEITALVHQVAMSVADDLSATATTTGAALTATHGDCTTHALRFAALASAAGIPTRVVTGLRIDGESMVRHRWNLAWTGSRWITVDPTWDESPASARLVGLAAHGARAADLAAADATVFDGLGSRAELR